MTFPFPYPACRSALLLLFASFICAVPASAQLDLDYYLPEGIEYDPEIPTPRSVLGFEVGEWHVRHDQLVEYLRTLAAKSSRVSLHEYGRTHEQRVLLLLTITDPENHEHLEDIRTAHVNAALGKPRELRASPDERPVVAWMGYSVHGNESSGANAALLVAYHLAAAQGAEVEGWLENAVILIDPCLNPDWLSRFAQWANSHRGIRSLVGDPAHREHREVWPGGRTNHYWFDLNRDWLLLTHPESRGRLTEFHRWKPNILTDFHEMGSNSTYFFQPGVPSRQNPNTPSKNLDLTRKIARYHARILDTAGSLYYTEETFDDFYYGKGSTYPDVNGAIGILFEQASSRGHVQESSFGLLRFPFTIRNQFLTSLSSLRAAVEMRTELLAYQRQFYQESAALAEKDPVRAYLFGCKEDPARLHHFLDILQRHQIEVVRLASRVSKDGKIFEPGHSYLVPLNQPQYRLIKSLFEKRTEFPDPVFYDVSTWTLPLSFGLAYTELTVEEYTPDFQGPAPTELEFPAEEFDRSDDAYAYLFSWDGYYAPRALHRLLSQEVRVRVATRPFSTPVEGATRDFDYGTIVVPMGVQDRSADEIETILEAITREDGIEVTGVGTGLTEAGIDLGSPSVRELKKPVPLVVVGRGISSYEVGEVWHLLDRRYEVELSLIEITALAGLDLSRYTHVILASGRYGSIDERTRERLRTWIRGGGVAVALRGSTAWATRHLLGREPEKTPPSSDAPPAAGAVAEAPADEPASRPVYADYERERARQLVSGTIFEAHIDRTHPLGFGYPGPTVAVFRNSRTIMETEKDPLTTVVQYTDDPLISGFVSPESLDKIRNSAVVCANRLGRGAVIRINDNPNFRGVWYGTNKLFANAIFFGGVIKNTSPVITEDEEQH